MCHLNLYLVVVSVSLLEENVSVHCEQTGKFCFLYRRRVVGFFSLLCGSYLRFLRNRLAVSHS